MNTQIAGLRVAGTIFALVALAHLLRLAKGLSIQIGSHEISFSAGAAGAIVAAGLSFWMWKLSLQKRP